MQIVLHQLTKKFKHDTIFRDLSLTIYPGEKLGIAGPNGSGKSTLLKIISGQASPTKGTRAYYDNKGTKLGEDCVFGKISYAAPYIELIEEFNLQELIGFYRRFRSPYLSSVRELVERSGITVPSRLIKDYSSGMKQRIKLLLALCFESELVLLDEPSTNLDQEGVVWTKNLIRDFLQGRSLIIASNEPNDFEGLSTVIDIRDYK